tara:strand:- start:491 stop:1138 length:648 start_codon:yes stop_codon:yes gene_type:complete
MSKNNFNQNNSKLNFDVQSNMINDACYVDSYLKQTQGPGEYFRSNLRSQVCEAPTARNLALSQPNVNFADGYGYSAMNGCNIDVDSNLRNNTEALTNKKCIQTLNERPYKTVPFMGRGLGDINQELDVLQGVSTFVNKSCNTLAEYDYSDRHFIPMIEKLEKNVQNTKHIVNEDASPDWVRGGIPSRQLIRNKEFLEKCGFKLKGHTWMNEQNNM